MDPRYPIGKFTFPTQNSSIDRQEWIDSLERLPKDLSAFAITLSEAMLETPYREGGWTARQVIHHLADSHMNAYCRIRLALTEDCPTVKSYEESLWAELTDARCAGVGSSLALIAGLHSRLVYLLNSLAESDWQREVFVPYFDRRVSVAYFAALYAWHGKHHLEHVRLAKECA